VRVHFVEPLGRGGIFQHTVAIASALDGAGVPVVLHTASDPEFVPPVELCKCVDWKRDQTPAAVRKLGVAASYSTRTIPHLVRSVRCGDVLHFEGLFKAGLGAATVAAVQARGVGIVFSPHNTFARSGRLIDRLSLRAGVRAANVVVVFSRYDAGVIGKARAEVVVSPLIQAMPRVDPGRVRIWREEWAATGVALVAGQVRPDKGLGTAVAAAALWGPRLRLAVVGEDAGGAAAAKMLAEELDVDVAWSLDYVPLEDFVAALKAADVILCPYPRASQSGVLSLARRLGTPAVATSTGGLPEYATMIVPPGDPGALAEAAVEACGRQRNPADDATAEAVRAHLVAYQGALGNYRVGEVA
jgi:glycosyltransferase involved in cell wall biosynthesis